MRHRACLLLLLCLAGCSGAALPSVSGTVTWNGAPLEGGFISFLPESGVQATCKGDIKEGRYEVPGITPGNWRVVITPLPRAKVVSTPWGEQRAQVSGAEMRAAANAKGNNQVVTIGAENQTLDFDLQVSQASGRR
jgi:hypothetical protein